VRRPNLSTVVLCTILVALILSPSILSARAVFQYFPAVVPGQFAQYKVLDYSCQSAYPQLCQSFETSLNDTTYAATEITGVASPSINVQLISVYKNGTGRHTEGLVNVETGGSNITAFSLGTNDYFVLAGGLRATYGIWNTLSAPTLNKTISEMVAGSLRNVNLLNYTLPGSFMGLLYSQSLGFAFDQSSGFLIELQSSLRTTTVGILSLDFAIVMVDNNVWGTAHVPDFGLSATPATINVTGNSPVNSTITLHRLYGFSATVSLSAISSPSGLSCSLYPTDLPMGGSDASKLSCDGSPGTYTVTVDGNGGYSTHTTPITIIVNTGPIPSRPASNLPTPLIYEGIGVAIIVAGLVAVLLLRRKPSEIGIAG
jgi:hypothetical protein